MNYYNEFDHNAAEWLRQLIEDGLIPKGDVDERSIADVRATELVGYTQCHFFAGISGWPLALQLAGWPEDKPVWTGSCPCQAFSTAGKQLGFADERDLWPVFRNLIAECRPDVVFGEQVENAIKHGWLDRVYADLERENYACGSVVLGAHSVGAPHRRYRLYWGGVRVADSNSLRRECKPEFRCDSVFDATHGEAEPQQGFGSRGTGAFGMANRNSQRLEREPVPAESERHDCAEVAGRGESGGVDDPESHGRGICNAEMFGSTSGEIDIFANSGDYAGDMGNAKSDDQRRDPLPGAYGERGEDRGSSFDGNVEYSASHGRDARRAESDGWSVAAGCAVGGMANCNGERQQEQRLAVSMVPDEQREAAKAGLELRSMASLPPWQRSAFIYCRDHKIRRVPAESLLLGVADGVSGKLDGIGVAGISETGGFPLTTQKEGRAMLLKGYGNAIVPQVAAEFVKAFMAEME